MPELPEVETVRRGIAKYLTGKSIARIIVRRGDLRKPVPPALDKQLKGRVVKRISRRAKYIIFHLDDASVLIIHLGMSGSLILREVSYNDYRTHDHVIIVCEGGLQLVFHDPRRFGLIALAQEKTLAAHILFSRLGPEPLDKAFNGKYLYRLLQKSKAPVKAVIMDQQKLVGVGNIYASEALFRAHIHPARIANTVTHVESALLANSIKQVLKAAIVSGGSTLRNYVRSSGDAGYFQHHFNVYGRQKKPCLICTTPVALMRQAGRSTFFCSQCQK